MDDSGNIYRFCKCGERIEYDRDCHKCGAKSETANDLAETLRDAVISEIPDPLQQMRDGLRREHERRRRAKKHQRSNNA